MIFVHSPHTSILFMAGIVTWCMVLVHYVHCFNQT